MIYLCMNDVSVAFLFTSEYILLLLIVFIKHSTYMNQSFSSKHSQTALLLDCFPLDLQAAVCE
jgi:hypothetical protein